MTPLPKKKHTRARSGSRANASVKRLLIPNLVKCKSCGELKYPHTVCTHCKSYK